jgi:hypothetical protein
MSALKIADTARLEGWLSNHRDSPGEAPKHPFRGGGPSRVMIERGWRVTKPLYRKPLSE